jgi:hypothetical protein
LSPLAERRIRASSRGVSDWSIPFGLRDVNAATAHAFVKRLATYPIDDSP